MIPSPKSTQWLSVYIFYTIIIFIALFVTRIILGSEIFGKYISVLLMISMITALIPCLGGFMGKQIFFKICTFSTIAGILYMFYVVLGNTEPGWGDLSSIVGYLFIVGVGAALALVIESIHYFIKKKNR